MPPTPPIQISFRGVQKLPKFSPSTHAHTGGAFEHCQFSRHLFSMGGEAKMAVKGLERKQAEHSPSVPSTECLDWLKWWVNTNWDKGGGINSVAAVKINLFSSAFFTGNITKVLYRVWYHYSNMGQKDNRCVHCTIRSCHMQKPW